MSIRSNRRTILWCLASLAVGVAAVYGQRAATPLPDWSGVWQMVGPTVFDTATVEPPNGRAGEPGVRERPPYNAEWETRYLKNIEGIRKGVFPDPVNTCGTPHGFPRILNLPDVYEFVVRPSRCGFSARTAPTFFASTRMDASTLRPKISGRLTPAIP